MEEMKHKIEWKDVYKTEIETIDNQHKKIIGSLNVLYNSISNTEPKEKILKYIKNLDFYTTDHFNTEQKYMKMYKYPKMKEHIERHAAFKQIYNEIRFSKFYTENNYTYQLSLHLCSVLMEWLFVHLPNEDRELAEFLKEKFENKFTC